MRIYKKRPLMMVAAEDDSYCAVTVKSLTKVFDGTPVIEIFEKGGHGTYLFDSHIDLDDKILTFLRTGKN